MDSHAHQGGCQPLARLLSSLAGGPLGSPVATIQQGALPEPRAAPEGWSCRSGSGGMLSLSSIVSMKVFPLTVNTITGEAGGRASEQRRADIRGHPAASGAPTEAPHRGVHRGLILGYRELLPRTE
jgi:hypothetical protein